MRGRGPVPGIVAAALAVACGRPDPAPTPSESTAPGPTADTADTANPTSPPAPTGDTAAPAPTGDTGPRVTPDGYPYVPPLPVDCAAWSAGPPLLASVLAFAPTPFQPQTGGSHWFATQRNEGGVWLEGIWEGAQPLTATLVHPAVGPNKVVAEDPYGTLWWTAEDGVWRVVPGGAPERFAALQPALTRQDLELHPHGSVVTVEFDAPFTWRVTFVDPSGQVSSVDTADHGLGTRPQAAAWARDWRSLWLTTETGLWSIPVDPDGAPDWTGATLARSGVLVGVDLLVDECGGVYEHLSVFYGLGSLRRWDPATGATAWLGEVEQLGSQAPLRFERVPGGSPTVTTMSGGWTQDVRWSRWQVGAGEPAWP